MKKIIWLSSFTLLGILLMFASSCKKDDNDTPTIVTDIDGNVYTTVTIGTQVWMVENLKTTRYNDGTSIPTVTSNTAWNSLTTGAYCNYNNTSNLDTITTYGRLYNWYAVNTGKLAPKGWHVSTDAEWTILENYLIANGYNYDGTTTGNGYAKSLSANTKWESSTVVGAVGNTDYPEYRNKSGFTALPGGFRRPSGEFNDIGLRSGWWHSTESNEADSWNRNWLYYSTSANRNANPKTFGLSVRCLKD